MSDMSNRELIEIVCNAYYQYPSHIWGSVSMELKDLINNMLVVDTNKRFSVSQCLDHPFISGIKRKRPQY